MSEIIKINMSNNTSIDDIKILRGGKGRGNLYMYLTTRKGEKVKIKLPKEKFLDEATKILKTEIRLKKYKQGDGGREVR